MPDVIIAGAGLAAALIARRLSLLTPPPDILILEKAGQPFGKQTWSFHADDVEAESLAWLEPLVAHRWAGQSVRFAGFARRLSSGYASLTSASVAQAIASLPNVTLRTGVEVAALGPDGATLADGTILSAGCVIDARGFARDPALVLGYQKFLGLEVETATPHGLTEPVIMDATVAQLDGYRFVYLLPFSPTRLLIEDTRYADGARLDTGALEADILAYAAAQGWAIAHVARREEGVLPITLAFDANAFWSRKPRDIPQAGMAAALFHPTTGYSLPDAVRVAELIAAAWPIGSAALAERIRDYATNRQRQQGFYRLLNRMLFRAAEPQERRKVLARFYRLPQPLIERFYAGRTTLGDQIRILSGKPPVPLHRALRCLDEQKMLQPETA